MTQKQCEEAHLAGIASEAVQVNVIAIVYARRSQRLDLCKLLVSFGSS